MPKAYSSDLRWRIVWSYLYRGQDIEEVAEQFFVCTRTVRRFVDLFLNTGDVTTEHRKPGPSKKLSETEQLILLQILFENPGIYLDEIKEKLQESSGLSVAHSTICVEVHELGLTRQKMSFIMSRRCEDKRAEFLCQVMNIPARMFVFVDETGSNQRDLHREHGYGLRGTTPVKLKFQTVNGKRISVIAAMSTNGVEDFYIVEGSVNGEIFCEYLRNSLLPLLQPFNGTNSNSIVIIDNASIHHLDEACQLILNTGSLLWFLPPYSPDLNPIEQLFHQVKAFLRNNQAAFHTTSNPRVAIASAFAQVTRTHCCAYIGHAGYLL